MTKPPQKVIGNKLPTAATQSFPDLCMATRETAAFASRTECAANVGDATGYDFTSHRQRLRNVLNRRSPAVMSEASQVLHHFFCFVVFSPTCTFALLSKQLLHRADTGQHFLWCGVCVQLNIPLVLALSPQGGDVTLRLLSALSATTPFPFPLFLCIKTKRAIVSSCDT